MENGQLIVTTKKGKIRGFEENNVDKWFGIPYAKPPVDELRFKRAQEHETWEGIKDCYQMGKRPYQFMDEKIVKLAGSDLPSSEDCLRVEDRKSTRLNSSHVSISYAVFCLKKKKQ